MRPEEELVVCGEVQLLNGLVGLDLGLSAGAMVFLAPQAAPAFATTLIGAAPAVGAIVAHQKENEDDTNGVARGEHTLEQKMLLEHYTEVGIPLPLIAD